MDAGPLEPPDSSCAGFGSTSGGLAACGSIQPWVAPALGYEGFAINDVSWMPIHGSDGLVALVISKREPKPITETYVSAYRFDEQGACVEHIGTLENVTAFWPVQLHTAVSRGGTTAVLIAFYGRVPQLIGFQLMANGKALRSVQGDARMDVTPQGEIVLAQAGYDAPTGQYTLDLTVLDHEGTVLRAASPPAPGTISDLDAGEPGQLIALYRALPAANGASQPSRQVERYDAALTLQGSWLAPENVNLTALDVQAGRVAVAGGLWNALTVWTHVLELPGFTPVWAAPAEAPALEDVSDLDLTADGRVFVGGSAHESESYAWLMGYGADGTPLWSEPRTTTTSSAYRLTVQQNDHILLAGASGYCE